MAVLGRGSTSLMSRPRADLPLRLITASYVNFEPAHRRAACVAASRNEVHVRRDGAQRP